MNTEAMNTGALNAMLADCEDILAHLDALSVDLADAIERDIDAKRWVKQADEELGAAEAEIIAEAAIKAKLGDKLAAMTGSEEAEAAAAADAPAEEAKEGDSEATE